MEEVYVRQPTGFFVKGHEEKVLQLDKALYGLRQVLRAWNDKLDKTLCALGFKHSESEHAVYTNGEPRLKLSKESMSLPVDATEYRGVVGSLRYLVHTSPDITFAVRYVSRFMEHPTTEHLGTVKRILPYIAGAIDYDYHFRRNKGDTMLIF